MSPVAKSGRCERTYECPESGRSTPCRLIPRRSGEAVCSPHTALLRHRAHHRVAFLAPEGPVEFGHVLQRTDRPELWERGIAGVYLQALRLLAELCSPYARLCSGVRQLATVTAGENRDENNNIVAV
jgi:hypothetical protein